MSIIQEIAELFHARGASWYGGEAVTQTQHALQSASLAAQAHAPQCLIVAALLHDIGHLLHDLEDNAAAAGIDDLHEQRGHQFLQRHFGAEVSEPVRLHVAAKRYLCTTDATYGRGLSPASQLSLQLQGGLMSPEECVEFESSAYHQSALQLRRWDDAAKELDRTTPGIEHFLSAAENLLVVS